MERLTKDEQFIIVGIGTSAAVTGLGVMLFYAALMEPTTLGYMTDMFLGTTLSVSGVVGVMGFCSIFFNYRAIL
jgi:hypothetical protein